MKASFSFSFFDFVDLFVCFVSFKKIFLFFLLNFSFLICFFIVVFFHLHCCLFFTCVSFHFLCFKVLYVRASQRERAPRSVGTPTKVFEFVKLILRP